MGTGSIQARCAASRHSTWKEGRRFPHGKLPKLLLRRKVLQGSRRASHATVHTSTLRLNVYKYTPNCTKSFRELYDFFAGSCNRAHER